MSNRTKYCPDCGTQLNAGLTVCDACGSAQPSAGKQKSAGLAVLLSLLLAGLGQVYLGRIGRAVVVFLGAFVFTGFLVAVEAGPLAVLYPVVAAIDAYVVAGAVNRP